MRKAADPVAKSVALSLLRSGKATPSEIAARAGVSRQLVESWAKCAKVDWKGIKGRRLEQMWLKELQRGFTAQRQVQQRKPRLYAAGGQGVASVENQEALADSMSRVSASWGGEND